MPDNLPGNSRDKGAGHPLTPAQFRKREQGREALEIWLTTQSYQKVCERMGLRNEDVARALVKKGEDLWAGEELGEINRYKALLRGDLMELRAMVFSILRDESTKDRLTTVAPAIKVMERLAKLLDLDEERPAENAGMTFVIETRHSWEMGDAVTIDAEIIEPAQIEDGLQ